MGELIALSERRRSRSREANAARPVFHFDLSCPFSYLAAERVEWILGEVEWVPVAAQAMGGAERLEEIRARAVHRAAELRLPLVWPDRFPEPVPGALRAAHCAAQLGAGARFALAAARLAFCGGFDLEDPEVLAEAAAAAGVTLEDCLAAAGDASCDASLRSMAHELAAQGVYELPVVRIGSRLFAGEQRLAEAAALLAWRAEASTESSYRPGEQSAREARQAHEHGGWDAGVGEQRAWQGRAAAEGPVLTLSGGRPPARVG